MGCSGFDGGSDAISDVAHCCRASRPAWVAESCVSRRKGLVVRYRRRWVGRVRWFRYRGGGCVHEARGTGRASRAAGPWRARPGIPASQQPSSPYSLAPQGKLGPIGAPSAGPLRTLCSVTVAADAPCSLDISVVSGVTSTSTASMLEPPRLLPPPTPRISMLGLVARYTTLPETQHHPRLP